MSAWFGDLFCGNAHVVAALCEQIDYVAKYLIQELAVHCAQDADCLKLRSTLDDLKFNNVATDGILEHTSTNSGVQESWPSAELADEIERNRPVPAYPEA